MSQGMNRVMLLGNLGADPELRHTANGTSVLHFRLATTETFVDKSRQVQEKTEWHDITVWGPRAESLAKILTKGSCVLVEGGLHTSSYEKDGVKRYRTEVVAKEVCLTPRRASATLMDGDYSLGSPAKMANGGRNGSASENELAGDEIPF